MEYGSVCGGISNMNMTVANAHGVPAFTVGQPGHCAYVWRSDDKTWGGRKLRQRLEGNLRMLISSRIG